MKLHRPGQKAQKSALINATIKEKKVYTDNGAITNSTSLNPVLDMFFLAGASRKMSEKQIIDIFIKAYAASKILSLKCLFWARDIRGGAGERRFFRIVWEFLVKNYPQDINKIKYHVPEYGRWDDLFFNFTVCKNSVNVIKEGLYNNDSLLAKWLPRKGKIASYLRFVLGFTAKVYRLTIANLSKTVEQNMCKKKWENINYEHVPSVAMNKYRKAFYRNDEKRFTEYINLVTKGKKIINANAIFPHTLVQALYKGEDKKAVEAQWNALPDYMVNSNDKVLPVCDTSGSMNGLPLDVSLALGVYISERNKGIFKNAFITFSAKPEMHYIKGTLWERLMQIRNSNAGYNTNLQAVFDLILSSAVNNNVPEKDMPNKILILSDMEFDGTGGYNSDLQKQSSKQFLSNFEVIKRKYKSFGYNMPTLVFWNLKGRPENVPATKDDRVGLVSGFSPSILKSILNGEIYSPTSLMLKTLNSERYNKINLN